MTSDEAKDIFALGERRLGERRASPSCQYGRDRRRSDRRSLDPTIAAVRAAWAAEVMDLRAQLDKANQTIDSLVEQIRKARA